MAEVPDLERRLDQLADTLEAVRSRQHESVSTLAARNAETAVAIAEMKQQILAIERGTEAMFRELREDQQSAIRLGERALEAVAQVRERLYARPSWVVVTLLTFSFSGAVGMAVALARGG